MSNFSKEPQTPEEMEAYYYPKLLAASEECAELRRVLAQRDAELLDLRGKLAADDAMIRSLRASIIELEHARLKSRADGAMF